MMDTPVSPLPSIPPPDSVYSENYMSFFFVYVFLVSSVNEGKCRGMCALTPRCLHVIDSLILCSFHKTHPLNVASLFRVNILPDSFHFPSNNCSVAHVSSWRWQEHYLFTMSLLFEHEACVFFPLLIS